MGVLDAGKAAGADILTSLAFFTRLPMPASHGERRFADALWAAPLAGTAVAAIAAMAFWTATLAGLTPAIAALTALAAAMLATGCLHEDGLADVADGFGGGATRERKLEIMRDSRIGTFGVAALFVSLGLRWAALAALAQPAAAAWSLLAAHGASRALLPAFLMTVPAARPAGLGAGVGPVRLPASLMALALGAILLLPLGLVPAALAAGLLAAWFLCLRRLCLRQIGGQTGDVCGTLQQGAEIAVLLAASRFLS